MYVVVYHLKSLGGGDYGGNKLADFSLKEIAGELLKLPFILFTSSSKEPDEEKNNTVSKDFVLKVAGALLMFMLAYGFLDFNNKINGGLTENSRQWAKLSDLQTELTKNCKELEHLKERLGQLEKKLDK
jgi:hypothetical protein